MVLNQSNLENFLEEFYAEIRQDDLLGPIFNNVVNDWDLHLKKVLLFWNNQLFNPGTYHGNLLKIHQKLNIIHSAELYQRWIKLFETISHKFFDGKDLKKLHFKARIIGGTLYGRINNCDLTVPNFAAEF